MESINPTNLEIPEENITLKLVVENSLEGIAIIGEDYTIEYVNDKVCEIIGMQRDDVLGQDFRQFVHSASSNLVSERYEKRLKGIAIRPMYEAKVLFSESVPRDVRIKTTVLTTTGSKVKILAQILDITKEKQTQQELSDRNRIYHTLVRTMNEGLGFIDERGIITYANNALCKMLDYAEDNLVGKMTNEIMQGYDLDTVFNKIKDRIHGKSDRYETNLVHRSGKWIPTLVSAAPLHNESGEYTGSCVVFTDITERKAVESSLRIAGDRALLYLDLMRHDIRNHLQEIQVSAELLRFQNGESSTNEFVETILQAVSKSTKVITDSRTIEQLSELPLTERQLDSVLCESMKDASELLENVVISLSLHVKDVRVRADEYLEVLLSDLLSNAYHHNPNDEKRIWIDLTESEDEYELTISDNGQEIPHIIRNTLFSHDHRVQGVGLHLVRHIVEKYGGTIKVLDRIDGNPSQGTRVTITFPRL